MKSNKLILFCFAIAGSLCFSACTDTDLELSLEEENGGSQDTFINHSVSDYIHADSTTLTTLEETPDTMASDSLPDTSPVIADTPESEIFVNIYEIHPDEAEIAKDVIMKAREIYLDLYSFSFENRISVTELSKEQSKICSEKTNGKTVNFLIDDSRYNTWDALTGALLKCFTENAVDVFQTHTVTTFYDIDDCVYASHGYAGFEGPDFVKAIDITDISDDKFVLKSCAYRISENSITLASFDTYYFDTTFIKEDNGWKIDSSSEGDRLFYMFSYCEDLQF